MIKCIPAIWAGSVKMYKLNVCFSFVFHFQMKEAIMNQEKLAKLQAQVRIGGKVTVWSFVSTITTYADIIDH